MEIWQPPPPSAAPPAEEATPASGTPAFMARYGTCVAEKAPRERQRGLPILDDETLQDDAHKEWTKSVTRALRSKLAAVEWCYEDALRVWPRLAGDLKIRLVFARDGSVASASVEESSLRSEPVACCVLDVLRTLHAAAPVEGQSVVSSYPFVFAPQTPDSKPRSHKPRRPGGGG